MSFEFTFSHLPPADKEIRKKTTYSVTLPDQTALKLQDQEVKVEPVTTCTKRVTVPFRRFDSKSNGYFNITRKPLLFKVFYDNVEIYCSCIKFISKNQQPREEGEGGRKKQGERERGLKIESERKIENIQNFNTNQFMNLDNATNNSSSRKRRCVNNNTTRPLYPSVSSSSSSSSSSFSSSSSSGAVEEITVGQALTFFQGHPALLNAPDLVAKNLLVFHKIYNLSDERLKSDFKEIPDELVRAVLTLKPYRYTIDGTPCVGYKAQEIPEALLPICRTEFDTILDGKKQTFYSVDYHFVSIINNILVQLHEQQLQQHEERQKQHEERQKQQDERLTTIARQHEEGQQQQEELRTTIEEELLPTIARQQEEQQQQKEQLELLTALLSKSKVVESKVSESKVAESNVSESKVAESKVAQSNVARPSWECTRCTYVNSKQVTACAICHTKESDEHVMPSGEPGDELETTWACLCCTYINSKQVTACAICHTKKSAVNARSAMLSSQAPTHVAETATIQSSQETSGTHSNNMVQNLATAFNGISFESTHLYVNSTSSRVHRDIETKVCGRIHKLKLVYDGIATDVATQIEGRSTKKSKNGAREHAIQDLMAKLQKMGHV
jgi:hypothetical protein